MPTLGGGSLTRFWRVQEDGPLLPEMQARYDVIYIPPNVTAERMLAQLEVDYAARIDVKPQVAFWKVFDDRAILRHVIYRKAYALGDATPAPRRAFNETNIIEAPRRKRRAIGE